MMFSFCGNDNKYFMYTQYMTHYIYYSAPNEGWKMTCSYVWLFMAKVVYNNDFPGLYTKLFCPPWMMKSQCL